MIKRSYIKDSLYDTVINTLEHAAQEFDIEYTINDVFIYGSSITDIINPNDINIYIELESISSSNIEEFQYDMLNTDLSQIEQIECFLTHKLHKCVHGEYNKKHKQPYLDDKPVDINVCNYKYNLDGEKIDLKKYLQINKGLIVPQKDSPVPKRCKKQGKFKF